LSETADLVVIGGGPGGMAAALEAALHGASVILLEADSHIGGNAARSTGYLAFQNFDMQMEAGLSDSVETFVTDMAAEIDRQNDRYGITFDEGLALLFAEESSETYSWLVNLGFEFNRFLPRPKQHSVNRMVDVKDTTMFTTLFQTALEEAGVKIITDTRVRRLLAFQKSIVGVATDNDNFMATKGVVLAAGGYQANSQIRIKYQPEMMAKTPYLGTKYDVGDGHLMGQEVGGDLINMTMIPPLIMVASALVEESIAVNREGCRFHDEAGPYDYRVDQLSSQTDNLAWYIFDERTFRNKQQLIDEMPEESQSAQTLNELAQKIGCDVDGLTKAINEWNSYVVSTTMKDPEFGRVIFPDPRVGIVEPPFHASRMIVGINFPAGGFRVTNDMQVVNVYGEPIDNLFAVGDCAGGMGPVIGMGGMRITPALTLGRIAGRRIATNTTAETIPEEGHFEIPENKMKIPVVDE
jgi:succinate dehydrogenase/fumarate reductase flavoprotein subunit